MQHVRLAPLAVIFSVALVLLVSGCTTQDDGLNLAAKDKSTGAGAGDVSAAVGWSRNADYSVAVPEAVAMAKGKLGGKSPNFAYVVYISEENHDQIISAVRDQVGPGVKIVGMTSNTIFTNDGVIDGVTFSIGVLLVASDDITFGIGTVDLSTAASPEAAGNAAITEAIADAGKAAGTPPQVVLYVGTTKRGEENRIMDGIAEVIGMDVPVVGGNSKDFGPKFANNWRQFTQDETFESGLVLVAIYPKNAGWGFEATFRLTDKKGTVTKSDGFRILEIDGRPALDVYDEWVDGEFYQRLDAGEFNSSEDAVDFALVKMFTLLNPIAKIVKGPSGQIGHFATSPIPDAQDVRNKSISVYAQVSTGDEISLYRGTWEVAMNRVESIPADALLRSGLKKGEGTFAVMIVCNGLKTVLPAEELAKVPAITDDVLGVPFMGAVTAGEQGPIPGIRNVNANLVESIVLVG